MQIGLVGLGKMGSAMLERLGRGGHDVVGYDTGEDAVARCVAAPAGPSPSRWVI